MSRLIFVSVFPCLNKERQGKKESLFPLYNIHVATLLGELNGQMWRELWLHRWASPLTPFISPSTNGQMTNFCLHIEQTVNEIRKISWASVFHFLLKWPRIHIHICRYVYTWKPELTHISNFCLFAENARRKQQTSIGLLQRESESGSLFSLVCKQINGNRRLLFQQTCPSLDVCTVHLDDVSVSANKRPPGAEICRCPRFLHTFHTLTQKKESFFLLL